MAVAVGRDLVATFDDLLDQLGPLLGFPPQDKERGLDPILIQYLQNTMGVRFNPTLVGGPIAKTHAGFECRDLIVVFDVDGQGIQPVLNILYFRAMISSS